VTGTGKALVKLENMQQSYAIEGVGERGFPPPPPCTPAQTTEIDIDDVGAVLHRCMAALQCAGSSSKT